MCPLVEINNNLINNNNNNNNNNNKRVFKNYYFNRHQPLIIPHSQVEVLAVQVRLSSRALLDEVPFLFNFSALLPC